MNRAVRAACALLFAGTTACSLIFSASATVAKAATVHVPGPVVWSAVGFLELLSLAGTLRWLTATTTRGRVHAIVVVVAAAAVTAQAGGTFYGWWGVLAPAAVVGTIHMVAETLNDNVPPAAPALDWDEAPHAAMSAPAIEKFVPPQVLDLDAELVARATALLAAEPKAGRPRLRTELDITDHTAKRLLAALRPVQAVETA